MLRKLLNNIWLITSLALSLYVGFPLTTSQHFHTHDDIQIFRVNEYLSCIHDGQLPCRWSRDLGKGYGYPLFIFYPPMIYAIPSIIVLLVKIPISFALNLFAFLTFPLAAFGMYRLVYVLTKRQDLAAISSMLYTLLPYHAVNIFVRGVYAENLAWSIAPLLFAELFLIIKHNKPIWLFSTLLAVVILTHNISTLLLFPLLAIWGGSLILHNFHKYKASFFKLLFSFVLALALSAFFLVPALFEKSLVQTESMISDYYSYLAHFPSFHQIFFSNYWGYGASSWGVVNDEMSFALGQVHWVGVVILGLLSLFFARQKPKTFFKNPIVVSLSFSLLLVLFLSHPRSTPIWAFLPPLQYIQFPWRLVGLAGFFTVTLFGYLSSQVPRRYGKIIGIVAVFLAFYLYGGFFRPAKFDNLVDSDFITGKLRTLQQQDHIFDYLPKTVKELPDFASNLYFSSQIPVTSQTISWTSSRAQLKVESPTEQELTLSVFDYPGWQATVNGQPGEIKPHSRFGLITVNIPKGQSEIVLTFKDTPLRKLSLVIAFFGLGILILGISGTIKYKLFQTK